MRDILVFISYRHFNADMTLCVIKLSPLNVFNVNSHFRIRVISCRNDDFISDSLVRISILFIVIKNHSPTDNVSSSAIIGFDTIPGPDASVMRNCTWSHSLFVFTICISTSVPCSFFATVYFKSKVEFFLSVSAVDFATRTIFSLNQILDSLVRLPRVCNLEYIFSVLGNDWISFHDWKDSRILHNESFSVSESLYGIAYLDNADNDVLQARSVRIIMQNKRAILWSLCTSKGWCSHARIESTQMIMKRIQVL